MLNSIVRVALVLGAVVIVAGPARPDDKQIRTKAAIDAAVVYLKQNYKTANPQGADAGPMAGLIGTGGGGASSGWEEGPTALAGISAGNARLVVDACFEAVRRFVGDAEQADDITVLAVRRATP